MCMASVSTYKEPGLISKGLDKKFRASEIGFCFYNFFLNSVFCGCHI